MVEIADIENAYTAKPLGADGVGHAVPPAVQPPAGFLNRNEEEVVINRWVALAAGTDERRVEDRLLRVRDVPHLKAVVVALKDVVTLEGHVRVDELVLPRSRRVVEARHDGLVDHELQILDRGSGVVVAGLEPYSRVVGARRIRG